MRVTINAGGLETKVKRQTVKPENIVTLSIEGELNEKDLTYLRTKLTNLNTLDLELTRMTSIPKTAFQGMTKIEKVVLPATVKR